MSPHIGGQQKVGYLSIDITESMSQTIILNHLNLILKDHNSSFPIPTDKHQAQGCVRSSNLWSPIQFTIILAVIGNPIIYQSLSGGLEIQYQPWSRSYYKSCHKNFWHGFCDVQHNASLCYILIEIGNISVKHKEISSISGNFVFHFWTMRPDGVIGSMVPCMDW